VWLWATTAHIWLAALVSWLVGIGPAPGSSSVTGGRAPAAALPAFPPPLHATRTAAAAASAKPGRNLNSWAG